MFPIRWNCLGSAYWKANLEHLSILQIWLSRGPMYSPMLYKALAAGRAPRVARRPLFSFLIQKEKRASRDLGGTPRRLTGWFWPSRGSFPPARPIFRTLVFTSAYHLARDTIVPCEQMVPLTAILIASFFCFFFWVGGKKLWMSLFLSGQVHLIADCHMSWGFGMLAPNQQH